MSKNNDSSDGGELFGLIVIAIIGLFVGGLVASSQKRKNSVKFPDTLEALPQNPKSTFVFTGLDAGAMTLGWVAAILIFFGAVTFASPDMAFWGVLIFIGAAAFGFVAVSLWQKSQAAKPLPPPPPEPEPLNLTKARVYTVMLPRSTPWQPETAYRFMEQILHKVGRLTFQIVAEPGRIAWRIVDLRTGADPSVITQAVHSMYPEAEVGVERVHFNFVRKGVS